MSILVLGANAISLCGWHCAVAKVVEFPVLASYQCRVQVAIAATDSGARNTSAFEAFAGVETLMEVTPFHC